VSRAERRRDPGLARTQSWFQDAVVRPSLPPSHRGPEGEAPGAHILPSATLTADERVAIYAEMHEARLAGVLAEDYAALRAIAGHAEFDAIVRGYLADHPPRSFTLSVLGRALPDWIARAATVERRELLADVARVELSMTRVFDAPRESALTPGDIAALPAETWSDPRPRLIGAIELLELGHRANAVVRSVREGLPMPSLEPERTRILVWRQDDVVWRRELEAAAFALLGALVAGASLADAIAAAEAAHEGDPEELATSVQGWMARWSADGLFASFA
jgi:hypothetical protein